MRGNISGIYGCTGGDSGYDGPDPDFGGSRLDNGTAQLTLSNGEVIWDLSGNVWEWVDWTLGSPLSTNMSQLDKPYSSVDGSPVPSLRELDVINTFTLHSPSTSFEPLNNSFNANHGMGMYYAGFIGGAATRGGSWRNGRIAGAFALSLNASSVGASTPVGFRCVFRP
jgi:formylglycine-generating enzyme required for sulfatase activity